MIIYLDTETTGLYPGEICQLSYIIQSKEDVKAKNFFFSVNSVDYGAYLVHGFSVDKLKRLSNGKRFVDFACEIEKDFETAEYIVAHNSSFDFMFLRREFERIGRVFYCKNEFCSMKNSVELCKLPRSRGCGYKYPKLSELLEFLAIPNWTIEKETEKLFSCESTFHDARFDTTALFLAVQEGFKCSNCFDKIKENI